jgi:uncharacterized protein
MSNRLAGETSPYLLQHRDNPVDWYPWGPEALQRARTEDRPILLSVGYSACHWCHVMEHESFEDPVTAELMNRHFVNIKVDREERPDIDSIYMAAVQMMTRHGGWPMTVFLTPEGAPFYGGTYYPPEPRHGMPSFRQVLSAIAETWQGKREDVNRSADELRDLLLQGNTLQPTPGPLAHSILDRAAHAVASRFDPEWGGFMDAPKFPQAMTLELLLRHWRRTGSDETLRRVVHTLRMMASGGMYDHVGGGFARYSVDERWLVPHFEKMLYDNALLARVYLYAWQATGDASLRRVVEETLSWTLREMTGPEGGFFSALDADSEGEEGLFYLWTAEQIDAAAGPEDGRLVRAYYGVTEAGNFEERNILHTWRSAAQVAAEAGASEAQLLEALERARPKLYDARALREWPGRDDKVLTAWNAMMLRSFAEAGAALDRPDYVEVASRSAEFLLRELRADGTLLRTWKDGQAKIPGFLEDHALLVEGLVALYEATFDLRWLGEATTLADEMLRRFWDEETGAFYDTASDAEPLVVRPRDTFDNATPSGNSSAVMALLRLAELTGQERYPRVAHRVLEDAAEQMGRFASAFGYLCCALDFHLAPRQEVAIVGDPGETATRRLLSVVRARWRPNTVVALLDPSRPADGSIPVLEGRTLLDGRAAAYVCERFACQRPTSDPAELAAQLGG